MDMYIEVPSGKIFLNGYLVNRIPYKPYVEINGQIRYLTSAEKRMAKEMLKAFAPIIDDMEVVK